MRPGCVYRWRATGRRYARCGQEATRDDELCEYHGAKVDSEAAKVLQGWAEEARGME